MLNWINDCEVVAVMYPYMTFEDGTEVVHSDLIVDGDIEKVIVHFERPTAEGFDSARCELPSYNWTMWEGRFTDEEKRSMIDDDGQINVTCEFCSTKYVVAPGEIGIEAN